MGLLKWNNHCPPRDLRVRPARPPNEKIMNYELKMKKRLLPCLLLFLTWQIQAQENIPGRIEQYEQEIAEGKVDEIKMLKNYIDLITYYSHIDISKTHFYFRKAIAYA